MIIKTPLVLALCLLGLARVADAQCTEVQKLTAGDGSTSDRAGISVGISDDSIHGDVAVVGAYWDASKQGAAYVYRLVGTSWLEEQKLTASNGAAGDEFGRAVDVCGDTIVVGARHQNGEGAAYVYQFNGTQWQENPMILKAARTTAGDQLGESVAIDNDVILVGARFEDIAVGDQGAAYVFCYSSLVGGWLEDGQLIDTAGQVGDELGVSVDLHGNTAVVGAHLEDTAGGNAGAAVVFELNGSTWTQKQTLIGSSVSGDDRFGYAVSVYGDQILVGAYLDDSLANNAGAAYIFRHNGTTWTEEKKLLASDGAGSDWFGFSVATSDDVCVVGAHLKNMPGTDNGSAYVFRDCSAQWPEDMLLTSSSIQGSDFFAYSVAVDGKRAAVGAYGDDDLGSESGSAYVSSVSDIELTSSTTCATGGVDTVAMSILGSRPNTAPVLLFLAAVDGVPVNHLIIDTSYDSACRRILGPTLAPVVAAPVLVSFVAFEIGACGKVIISNDLDILFK